MSQGNRSSAKSDYGNMNLTSKNVLDRKMKKV